jgi:hypothetical protein
MGRRSRSGQIYKLWFSNSMSPAQSWGAQVLKVILGWWLSAAGEIGKGKGGWLQKLVGVTHDDACKKGLYNLQLQRP